MAKNKRRRGVKTYRPHGAATIFYALFGLVSIACIAAFAILPILSFTKNGDTTPFVGYEYVGFTIRKYFSTLLASFMPKYDTLTQYFGGVAPSNDLLKIIFNFHEYVELVFGGIFGLIGIFALVEVLLVLAMILFGKSNHPGGIKIFAWLMFWFFAIFLGLTFMYLFFYQQIIGEVQANAGTSDNVAISFDLRSLLPLGAMFIVNIILSIIWRTCFKNRVPLARKKRNDDYEEENQNEIVSFAHTEPMPNQNEAIIQQPQPQPQPQPQQFSNNNGGSVITIGDRAYTKNTEITTADIPEGIASLGSSAFANCVNLAVVTLPSTLQEIGFNCFFNTPKLQTISFNGTVERWKCVKRGSNWLAKSGTRTVQCNNGKINVNPNH